MMFERRFPIVICTQMYVIELEQTIKYMHTKLWFGSRCPVWLVCLYLFRICMCRPKLSIETIHRAYLNEKKNDATQLLRLATYLLNAINELKCHYCYVTVSDVDCITTDKFVAAAVSDEPNRQDSSTNELFTAI